jgi:hypothetical protein
MMMQDAGNRGWSASYDDFLSPAACAGEGAPTLVLCGGTGMHWFFSALLRAPASVHASRRVLVVVPVSDDGGSSRCIIDAVGGPAVGDLRNVVLVIAKAAAEHRRDQSRGLPLNTSFENAVDEQAERDCGGDAADAMADPFLTRTPATPLLVEQFLRAASVGSGVLAVGPSSPTNTFTAVFYPVLKHRLDAACEEKAMRQRDEILAAFDAATRMATEGAAADLMRHVGSALSTFADTVKDSDVFHWRNASVGNMVLAGWMLQRLGGVESSPAAVSAALEAAVRRLCDVLDVPSHIAVVPACSWTNAACASDTPTTEGTITDGAAIVISRPRRLPTYRLRMGYESGRSVRGQTAISYGRDGVVLKLSPVTPSSPQEVSARRGGDGDPSSLAVEVVVNGVALSSSGVSSGALRRSCCPLVRRRVIVGCGSLFTSVLAAAAAMSGFCDGGAGDFEAVVLLNAAVDLETSVFFDPPVVNQGGSQSVCQCARRVAALPTFRLLRSIQRIVRSVSSIAAVFVAEGSAFLPSAVQLDAALKIVNAATATPSTDLCSACAAALTADSNGFLSQSTRLVVCPATLDSAGQPTGFFSGEEAFRLLATVW